MYNQVTNQLLIMLTQKTLIGYYPTLHLSWSKMRILSSLNILKYVDFIFDSLLESQGP